ncbi:Inner membrane protein YihY, formerly thought to be RNase BN [hydrothermal vent metagenome]|uniref:Inner membrane protein YihY, formerly thought to be RNase BN n=1 Tax=hydrothermal vent metagenome TaxID=652676 RepID=A0A3B0WS74_9ZZZZ
MINNIQNKITECLWKAKQDEQNWFQSHLTQALRIFYGTIRDLSGGLPSLRSMGLVYTTLLSLVPLLAVSFSVLKGFGAHNQLEPALINLMEPLGEKGIQVSQQIISFVDNMKVGVLGSLGLLFLIITVLSLVKKIESAFNFTWRITVTRNVFQRFSNYLSVILIGPLLLFTAVGITASFNSSAVIDKISAIEPFGTMLLLIGEIIPYILTILSFTLIYILIPNTKVRFKSAVYGAVIATILWKAIGALFSAFIVDSTNYTAIYSGFAIMIIFMLWIYISWLIILTGASISYYHQNPDRISDKSQIIRLSCRLREKLALTVMQLIAINFHSNEQAWTLKTLAKKTKISEPALMIVISALQSNDLITTSGKNNQHYLPSQSLENIKIKSILASVRSAEEAHQLHPDDIDTAQQVEEIILSLESAIADSVSDKTLRDLV